MLRLKSPCLLLSAAHAPHVTSMFMVEDVEDRLMWVKNYQVPSLNKEILTHIYIYISLELGTLRLEPTIVNCSLVLQA